MWGILGIIWFGVLVAGSILIGWLPSPATPDGLQLIGYGLEGYMITRLTQRFGWSIVLIAWLAAVHQSCLAFWFTDVGLSHWGFALFGGILGTCASIWQQRRLDADLSHMPPLPRRQYFRE